MGQVAELALPVDGLYFTEPKKSKELQIQETCKTLLNNPNKAVLKHWLPAVDLQ